MELYEDIYQQKFSFGKNRESFLKKLDEHKIENAKNYLKNFIKGEISGKTVIDFGSGSGLMSLAFCLLGASKVISVDIDESSVNCGRYLRDKYKINKKQWKIMKGSVLDKNFVQSLGKFDIVYSWGVIHHTGNMWKGLENIKLLVKKGGLLYIAIYNEFHGFPSSIARKKIKKFYAGTNELIKKLMNILLILQTILMRIVRIKNPIKYIKNYGESSARGMDFYTDIKDWLGGYPYEYATWQKLEEYYGKDGFILENLFDSSAGIGCHELLFKKEV